MVEPCPRCGVETFEDVLEANRCDGWDKGLCDDCIADLATARDPAWAKENWPDWFDDEDG